MALKKFAAFGCAALLVAWSSPSFAEPEPASCRNLRFADNGWTDITSVTALASVVFEALGYKPSTTMASVPISFAGLKNKQLDVSLGYWWPLQQLQVQPLLDSKSINMIEPPNLSGAKATLAVPGYAWAAGLKSFDDIARYRKELDGKIYGIESGSSANAKIQKMIDQNLHGLGGFKLVESSEAGMLVTLERAIRNQKWLVFWGWEPHPMNIQFSINYLSGGDATFGPNYGEARVYTLTATDFLERCPNAGKLVTQLRFSTQLENQLMQAVMNKIRPAEAARVYLKQNPQVLDPWLADVKTFDGKDGLAAAKAQLGL
ncbi:choline ABC transporter substrate-binding protein [Verminephrobacter eiseniae]|uniref:choline ABC transporter substrate-binding protein n=1 Tax=Verminephrobacter eiseniae TaxID=364317 RepID=UPI002238E388|nr:choline ABC transporter substrate-binding protein [Verminephrobacter eiseniae]MCW5260000.1 choline ABC transporter substrate-binding protein [Verminephrobacter eiseniae]